MYDMLCYAHLHTKYVDSIRSYWACKIFRKCETVLTKKKNFISCEKELCSVSGFFRILRILTLYYWEYKLVRSVSLKIAPALLWIVTADFGSFREIKHLLIIFSLYRFEFHTKTLIFTVCKTLILKCRIFNQAAFAGGFDFLL